MLLIQIEFLHGLFKHSLSSMHFPLTILNPVLHGHRQLVGVFLQAVLGCLQMPFCSVHSLISGEQRKERQVNPQIIKLLLVKETFICLLSLVHHKMQTLSKLFQKLYQTQCLQSVLLVISFNHSVHAGRQEGEIIILIRGYMHLFFKTPFKYHLSQWPLGFFRKKVNLNSSFLTIFEKFLCILIENYTCMTAKQELERCTIAYFVTPSI